MRFERYLTVFMLYMCKRHGEEMRGIEKEAYKEKLTAKRMKLMWVKENVLMRI